ncbi:hypothetical protein GTP81_23580 [Rugamonas sp. FT107W]|uniref:Dockerin domain-containing protein n=1 Tax=Duganella vulcania TaxID=2692166 RepID=A0A845HLV5_9BURK|nr:hypothetical protein [Duganella vulcania]MYN19730.1 hypothetical protein [Duganella vulcania]
MRSFSCLLAPFAAGALLAGLLAAPLSQAANETVPVVVLTSSDPNFPALDRARVEGIVRASLLSPSATSYLSAKVRAVFQGAHDPRYLVVYLEHGDISLVDTVKIALAPGYVVTTIDLAYQQQESDLEPGTFALLDTDMVFDTPVDSIPTAKAAAQQGCIDGTRAAYDCNVLLGADAKVQDVRDALLSPRVKVLGNIGHGYNKGFMMYDGLVTSDWFASLPSRQLNGKVIYLNSCQVHNTPLVDAIMGAGTRTFVGGTLSLPIGPSEEVFKCFWDAVLHDGTGMAAALGMCESRVGLVGFHGISGETGRFLDSNVGDDDNFTPGDAADKAPQSGRVKTIIDYFAGQVGQGNGVDLDVGGANRPVGLTHFLSLPPGARVTSAKITTKIRGSTALFYNDILMYNDSVSATEALHGPCIGPGVPKCDDLQPFLPYIALRDVLGALPVPDREYDFVLDLAKVPVRTRQPADERGLQPDEYRNLLGLLNTGHFDMVFGDDTTVDYSQLRLTYTLAAARAGELNNDGAVNRDDLDIVIGAIGSPAYGPDDPRDLDHDGLITVLDARKLVLLCDKKLCAK